MKHVPAPHSSTKNYLSSLKKRKRKSCPTHQEKNYPSNSFFAIFLKVYRVFTTLELGASVIIIFGSFRVIKHFYIIFIKFSSLLFIKSLWIYDQISGHFEKYLNIFLVGFRKAFPTRLSLFKILGQRISGLVFISLIYDVI